MNKETSPMLLISGLCAGYGKRSVLNEIDLEVRMGEIIAILGHNGSGKSTLLKAIFGLLPATSGQIEIKMAGSGVDINPEALIKNGISYVPQKSGTFSELTVEDNLLAAGHLIRDRKTKKARIDGVFELFPQISKRRNQRAAFLSGGERQSLALAMGLISKPKLLLIDEPSLGLAPKTLKGIFDFLKILNREHGVTIILVEQRVRLALDIADRVYILGNGKIKYSGTAKSLESDEVLRQAYL